MQAIRTLLDRVDPVAAPDPPGGSPEHQRRRLYEDLAGLFGALGARQRVLLVLEDLQWADPTSLSLIEILPRRLTDAPVGLLLTARTDEPGSRFQGTLLQLRRARPLNLEIPLDALPVDRVADMV